LLTLKTPKRTQFKSPSEVRAPNMFFSHVTPLIRLGRTRPLVSEDLPPLPHSLELESFVGKYEHLQPATPLRWVWQCFALTGKTARSLWMITLVRIPIAMLGPVFLKMILERSRTLAPGDSDGLLILLGLAVLLALTVIVDGVIVQHWFHSALEAYAKIRSALSLKIYRHALGISRETLLKTPTGDLVNHLVSDTEGVGEAGFFFPEMVSSVLLVTVTIALLVSFLGPAAWAGLGVAVLSLFLSRGFAKRYEKADQALWKVRDRRVTLMSQVLGAVRLIKMLAWESSVAGEVQSARADELRNRLDLVRVEAQATVVTLGTSLLIALTTFGIYSWNGGVLTAELIFPSLLLFAQLEHPLEMLPYLLKNIFHSRVASRRLQDFFALPKLSSPSNESRTTDSPSFRGFNLENVVVAFEQEKNAAPRIALDQFTLTVSPGESLAVIGSVGCGKSTLLHALLGEVRLSSGSISDSAGRPLTSQPVGYAPQEAFILNATVRQNIALETSRLSLNEIIQASALKADIAELPQGLDTEIGERGVTLSGGQKARIALARIAAADPDLVLLDDPLSAVDSKTENTLIHELIFGLWKNKTRVVVTHRLTHLSLFDRILLMENGRIVAEGPYDQLVQSSESFKVFLSDHARSMNQAVDPSSAESLGVVQDSTDQNPEDDDPSPTAKLMTTEERVEGVIHAKFFWDYLKRLIRQNHQTRHSLGLLLAGTTIVTVSMPILQSRWMGYWADHAAVSLAPQFALGVYAVIGIIALTCAYLEKMVWMSRSNQAATDLHDGMLQAVLSAPVRFFDTTPAGRILNRFSRDLQGIDDELSWNLRAAVNCLIQMLGTILLICWFVPALILALIPVLWLYYQIQSDYRKSAREAKRLESISRSPRFAHFRETLQGLPVIRALHQESRQESEFTRLLQDYTRHYWASILINRWFSTRAPLVSGIVALTTSVLVVIGLYQKWLSPGVSGILLTYSMTFWATLNWCVRSWSEVESKMTSLERVISYSDIPSEGDNPWADSESAAISPLGGDISVNQLSVRYAVGLPEILKGANLAIPQGARVGLIGRTGSGKSTLIQALFRLVEVQPGAILIGGRDVCSMSKQELRRQISIIPQDPTLFIGTIRSNLDRYSRSTDEQVWEALRRVELDSWITSLGGLTAPVVEGGNNLSQGQRQLLCLARALLQKNKILVLDEATASVDSSTDQKIQATLRQEFAGCTQLIIAHRLGSIEDCDLIYEFSGGQVRLIRS
jgi:ABC-type multidrug transport system fused ATPase/permease subunit